MLFFIVFSLVIQCPSLVIIPRVFSCVYFISYGLLLSLVRSHVYSLSRTIDAAEVAALTV